MPTSAWFSTSGHDPIYADLIKAKLSSPLPNAVDSSRRRCAAASCPAPPRQSHNRLHPVQPVDLNHEFLPEFRAVVNAARPGTRSSAWTPASASRARCTRCWRRMSGPPGSEWRQRCSRRALWSRAVRPRCRPVRQVLRRGRHDLLTRCRTPRRAADPPRGLWLLCPGESTHGDAQLDAAGSRCWAIPSAPR